MQIVTHIISGDESDGSGLATDFGTDFSAIRKGRGKASVIERDRAECPRLTQGRDWQVGQFLAVPASPYLYMPTTDLTAPRGGCLERCTCIEMCVRHCTVWVGGTMAGKLQDTIGAVTNSPNLLPHLRMTQSSFTLRQSVVWNWSYAQLLEIPMGTESCGAVALRCSDTKGSERFRKVLCCWMPLRTRVMRGRARLAWLQAGQPEGMAAKPF